MSKATLDQYHEAIRAAIVARVNAAETTVENYNDNVEELPAPCVLINLDELLEDPDENQSEDICYLCSWSLYCVVPVSVPNAERDVRNFALEVARIIRKANRFGFDNLGRPELINALPALIKPETKKYIAWVVTFEQTFEAPRIFADGELVPFITAHGEHHMADDAPIAADTITLPQD